MKKLFFLLTLIIILIIGSIYGILFTKYGNNIIASYLESQVNNEQKNLKLKVNNFILTYKNIIFDAVINDNSYIKISGDLSLFKKIANLKYDMKINDLSAFKDLLNQDLKGEFYTNGIFRGDKQLAILEGFSNIANSQTNYHFDFVKFKINAIKMEAKNAKIEELLRFFNKPEYIKGELNLISDLKNIKEKNIDGILDVNISKAAINNDVFNKELKQTLSSPINFQSLIKATFVSNQVEMKSELLSSIADIYVDKTVMNLDDKTFLSDYKINFKNLNRLEGMVGRRLNAEFSSFGKIKGENSLVFIDGQSDIFESSTKYKFELKDFVAQNLDFRVENARIEKFLHLLNEPIYLTGDFDINGKIKNCSLEKLDGTMLTKISNAKMINEVVNTVFKQEFQNTVIFNSEINTFLLPNRAVNEMALSSNIANINVNKAIYNFKEKSFDSDYLINISDLEKIKSYMKTPLRGNFQIKGNIENKDSILLIKGNSDVIGGVLNFSLKNDDLTAVLENANVKELLYVLKKPEIFDSKANLKLNYDLVSKKGNLAIELNNGHFLANDFSILIGQLAKFDLTKEVYEKTIINSEINDKLFVASANMQSLNTKIDMKDAVFDFEQDIIDAKIDTNIKNNNFMINLTGDMSKPNISLDAKELIKKIKSMS